MVFSACFQQNFLILTLSSASFFDVAQSKEVPPPPPP